MADRQGGDDVTRQSAALSGRVRASMRVQSVPWSPIRTMMSLASRDPDVVSLTVGQPNFDTPQHIVHAAKAALDAGKTRYGPVMGIPELRYAVARKLRSSNGIEVDPEKQIIITVGAQEAITLAFLALLDPGDEVIMPDPTYTNYHGHVPMVSARKTLVPARESDGFMMNAEDIARAVTPRSRILLINSPSNPTGAVASIERLRDYAEIAKENELLVVSDESYEAIVYEGARHVSIGSLSGMAERTISVFSFSKSYAMTGWRVGYLTGPAGLIEEMHKLQEEVVSCPTTFAQWGALAALEGPQDCVKEMVDEYDLRRCYLLEELEGAGKVSFLEPKGAFYLFLNVQATGVESGALASKLLEDYKVGTVPGSAFGPGGEGYLRLCYGSATLEMLRRGIERLCEGISKIR